MPTRAVLHGETGGRLRWTTIMAVAKRMDTDVRRAILLAADCAAAGLVRLDIKGPPYRLLPSSAILTEEGWALITRTTRRRVARTSVPCSATSAPKARKRRQQAAPSAYARAMSAGLPKCGIQSRYDLDPPDRATARRNVADRIDRFLNVLQQARRLPNRRELFWLRWTSHNLLSHRKELLACVNVHPDATGNERRYKAKGVLFMTLIGRRSFMVAWSVAYVVRAGIAYAVDALPDARFVGFAQAVNDFEIASGKLALAKSTNENVRGYATRAIAEHTEAAEELRKSRQEAGVSYAPDGRMGPNTANLLARLNSLQGPDFDAAFAAAQLTVQTDAVEQYGAYSQSGAGGPLRRYAQRAYPKSQMFLEYAKRLAGSR